MATATFQVLSSLLLLLCQFHHIGGTPTSAPTPPSGPANLTDILSKSGGFSAFLRLLDATQVGTQIQSQLNSSSHSVQGQGMTVFAPSDNAFNSLKAGTLNSLSSQEQVQLALYHVLPKLYDWDTFQTASNPVQTQASGSTGDWGVNITTYGVQQVNVSTGVVVTQINNALTQAFPLAVYQLEKVLLPAELFGSDTTTTPPVDASSPAADGPSASTDYSGGSTGIRTVTRWALLVSVALVFTSTMHLL